MRLRAFLVASTLLVPACSGDDAADGADANPAAEVPEEASFSETDVPAEIRGRAVIVTMTSGSAEVRVGETVIYRFISRDQIVGASVDAAYSSSDWSWVKDGKSGTLEIIYRDGMTFERYGTTFTSAWGGTCTYLSHQYFVGPRPPGVDEDYLEHTGECTFELDQTCVAVPDQAECDATENCAWDTRDVEPVCLPKPSDENGRVGMPRHIICRPSGNEFDIVLPPGSGDCQEVFFEYAEAYSCNNLGEIRELDVKYWQCRVCDKPDCP